jgi:hypothetical protein
VSFCRSPGNRNVAGEMLLLILMPLHPAPASKTTTGQIASRRIFRCNLTTEPL